MTLVSNAFTSYSSDSGSKRNRETFSDLISMITPDETPLYSLARKEKVDGTHPEWSIDTLATPVTTNKVVEGNTYAFAAITPTSRVGNYCQISTKEFAITETQEVVSKAGPKSEVGRERAKKGVELKCDIEAAMLSNNPSIAGAQVTARQSAGLRAWLATNDSIASGGASGGFNSSTGVVDAATNGSSQRTFTKTLLDDTIELTYKAGGNPTILMLSPYAKRVFSTFMSDSNVAAFRTPLTGKSQGTIVGAADTYLSDFGMIDVVPNRQMVRASITRNAYLITPDKIAKGFLRDIQEDKDVAKTGDALPRVLKAEWTLIVKNEAAHGVIADLFGTTSAS